MSQVKLRFAPSPTGFLHAGNARVAVINWLMAAANQGSMVLRIDDTDQERSLPKFTDAIRRDLNWLTLDWASEVRQQERLDLYDKAANTLKAHGRLYACYETPNELEFKRRRQLKAGKPPIYDRTGLNLSQDDRKAIEAAGHVPYFRFRLENSPIKWNDLIRGPSHFEGNALSDPILIRGDGTYLYHLPSCTDDLDLGITHIIRGEDHVSNTAIHIQIFEALGGQIPKFAHLPLMTDITGVGLSKRLGSTTVHSLREQGCEPIALAHHLAKLGSNGIDLQISCLKDLFEMFDIAKINQAKPKFDLDQLWADNTKFLHSMPFDTAKKRFDSIGLTDITYEFWQCVKKNLRTFNDSYIWHKVCFGDITPIIDDPSFLADALHQLPPEPWNNETWTNWTTALGKQSKRRGKQLFLPLRKAVTGEEYGPELNALLPLIGREKVVFRLQSANSKQA